VRRCAAAVQQAGRGEDEGAGEIETIRASRRSARRSAATSFALGSISGDSNVWV